MEKLLKKLDLIGLALEELINSCVRKPKQEQEVKMCGSLKHSAWASVAPIKPGETFPDGAVIKVEKDGEVTPITGETLWCGFARSEKLDGWISGGWLPGTLEVDGFTEQGKDFSVPASQAIKVIVAQKDKNYINIVTRQANKEEAKIHGRFPLTVEK